MISEETQKSPNFLVAKGGFRADTPEERYQLEKTHRIKLSNAIYMVVTNHGDAVVRAIGSAAIANAVRAITIASSKFKVSGINLVWESVFDKGAIKPLTSTQHTQDATAVIFSIYAWDNSGTIKEV